MRNARSTALVLALVVLSQMLIAQPASAAVTRISGESRWSTSVAVSNAISWPGGGTVFLASGENFPDALSAGPVAAAERGRLLLASQNDIPAAVADEIRDLAPQEIVVVGGPATLSEAVMAEARSLAPIVRRIGGADRTETSLALYDRMLATTRPAAVWVTSGTNFADALSAGAVAARLGQGLIVTTGPHEAWVSQLQQRFTNTRFLVAGGEASVAPATVQALDRFGSVERFGGTNRFNTAAVINQAFTTHVPSNTMMLVNGETFPDGLSGAVLAAALGVPMYLTAASCATTGDVQAEEQRLNITRTIVIGGTSAVSASAAELTRCVSVDSRRNEMVTLVNNLRAQVGAPPLTMDPDLNNLAQSWSQEMAATGNFVHNPYFCTVTFEAGFRRCGENIAWTTSSSPSAPMQFWTNSSGHYRNMTNPAFTHIGVGAVQDASGRWVWTQNFGG